MKNTIRITTKDVCKGKVTRSLLVERWVKGEETQIVEEYILSTDIGMIRELAARGYCYDDTLSVKATITINKLIENAEITVTDIAE